MTLCAFAPDPAKAYVDAVKRGMQPVNNCVKMLSNGAGNGMAVTNGVEANTQQDSYGGASVCIYCRCHVEHPAIDGMCRYKGKFVQIPTGTQDPIRFVLKMKFVLSVAVGLTMVACAIVLLCRVLLLIRVI